MRLYEASLDNLSRGELETRLTVSDVSVVQASLERLSEAIIYGCPELFFIDQGIEFSASGNEFSVLFTSKYPKSELSDMWSALIAEVERVASWGRNIQDPFERLYFLNRYLCFRVKPELSLAGQYGDPYGALILGEARCEGYAKAAKMILDRMGFHSLIAVGDALNGTQTERHAWNIVECDHNYYHFDFTWNASRTAYRIPGQDYLFLDDETAHKEHFPRHSYPPCSDDTHTFWAMHNGFVKYHSDLSRIDIVPCDNQYFAIAKLSDKLNEYDREDVFVWMRDELAGYNYGSALSYRYNDALDLLVFYFINED